MTESSLPPLLPLKRKRGHPALDPPGRSVSLNLTLSKQMFADIRHRSLIHRLDTLQDQIRADLAAAQDRFTEHPK